MHPIFLCRGVQLDYYGFRFSLEFRILGDRTFEMTMKIASMELVDCPVAAVPTVHSLLPQCQILVLYVASVNGYPYCVTLSSTIASSKYCTNSADRL